MRFGAVSLWRLAAHVRTDAKIDEEIYKWRHLIENFFAKIKEFKGVAMRSVKIDRNYGSMIFACAAVIRLR